MFIFLQLTRRYFGVAGISEIELSVRGLALYQLRYLPLILGSIFIFGPVTNAIRYAVVFFPEYKWNTYFPEYFFTARMYVNYLAPFFIFGYAILNVNLFLNYNDWQKAHFKRLTEGFNTPGPLSSNTLRPKTSKAPRCCRWKTCGGLK